MAHVQSQLYKIGAYGNIPYSQAVDGINGKITEAAWEKAKEMGYKWDRKTKSFAKEQPKGVQQTLTAEGHVPIDIAYYAQKMGISNPLKWYRDKKRQRQEQKKREQEYYSSLRDEDAIIGHKTRTGVKEPYIIVDKKANRMKLMKGNNVVGDWEVITGFNKGDGYRGFTENTPYYSSLPRQTGAGIYTVSPRTQSAYPGFGANPNEPLYFLMDGSTNTSMAIHAPAGKQRASLLGNGNRADNRASFGCISPNVGVLDYIFNNNLISRGDTVYILPEEKGNYIWEDPSTGKLSTVYSNQNPSAYKLGNKDIPLFYNKSK